MQNIIAVKRGKGAGYSGINNGLFHEENYRMLCVGVQAVIAEVVGTGETDQFDMTVRSVVGIRFEGAEGGAS